MLKHGILGLLNYKEMTGYEIMEIFRDSLNYFWDAKTSQIYRELQGLEQKECVNKTAAVCGIMLQALLIFELLYLGTENSEILPNRVERKDTMKKLTLALSIPFIVLTFAGAGYVLHT